MPVMISASDVQRTSATDRNSTLLPPPPRRRRALPRGYRPSPWFQAREPAELRSCNPRSARKRWRSRLTRPWAARASPADVPGGTWEKHTEREEAANEPHDGPHAPSQHHGGLRLPALRRRPRGLLRSIEGRKPSWNCLDGQRPPGKPELRTQERPRPARPRAFRSCRPRRGDALLCCYATLAGDAVVVVDRAHALQQGDRFRVRGHA